jgi:hypothetical protein
MLNAAGGVRQTKRQKESSPFHHTRQACHTPTGNEPTKKEPMEKEPTENATKKKEAP